MNCKEILESQMRNLSELAEFYDESVKASCQIAHAMAEISDSIIRCDAEARRNARYIQPAPVEDKRTENNDCRRSYLTKGRYAELEELCTRPDGLVDQLSEVDALRFIRQETGLDEDEDGVKIILNYQSRLPLLLDMKRNYIRFTAFGQTWEYVNGKLKKVSD